MAQTYTLEEAAERLGITPEEMKRRLKEDWKTLRSFRDGPTLRFRAADIDELARSMGAASDPGLPLADGAESEELGSDDFKVPAAGKASKPADDEPLLLADTDDVFSLSAEDPGPAPAKPAGKSDSDVRLEAGKPKSKAKDEAVVPTEEISIDLSGPGSAVIKGGSSAKLSAPKSSTKLSSDSGKGLSKPPSTTDSSEFELSLDADSDDFELQLNTDSSDEVDLGTLPKEGAGSGKKSGQSGINLRDPADSGISLEKGKPKKPDSGKGKAGKKPPTIDDSDVDFELSLDAGAGASGAKLGGPKSGAKAPNTSDSDSEFELTLDDSGGSSLEQAALESAEGDKGDIFETDFEIPPMSDESGSEAVAVESDTDLEKSDFELAIDDSDVVAEEETGSQVVLLEDEEAEATPSGRKKKAAAAAEDEDAGEVDLAAVEVEDDEDSASAALAGVKKPRADEDEDEEEEEGRPVAVAGPTPWGPLPAIVLLFTLPIVVLGGLMGYELVNTMWGYQQPRKPAGPLVRLVAEKLDMEIKDQ